MSNHFQINDIKTDGLRNVHRVDDFADRCGLDKKQRRDLLRLFGPFATLHELLINSRIRRECR